LALILLAWGLALLIPLALLSAIGGWNGTLAVRARFFTRVALLSFGGAYAVLPYVAQGAVEQFGWLSTSQMLDSLALGETTPGPLIMVVAFVGFMGGWNQGLGAGLADAGGQLGAGPSYHPGHRVVHVSAVLWVDSRWGASRSASHVALRPGDSA